MIVAIKRKQNKYRGTLLAIYILLFLALSMHKTLGADTQILINAMAARRVHHQDDMAVDRASATAEGREMTHLRRRYSFVLQHALSQHTPHHLCGQGAVSLKAARLHTDPFGKL